MRTVLVDYGAGNLHSVHKALLRAGLDAVKSADPGLASEADVLVLPGQGHFRQVMEAFLQSGFEPVLRRHLAAGKPFLGICVGLQLLMDASEEAPGVSGLGLVPGVVRRFTDPTVSVPQMGWNRLETRGDPSLLRGLPPDPYVYFANSYYADFQDGFHDVLDGGLDGGFAADGTDTRLRGAVTHYGHTAFMSALSQGNLHATQFHPEKSQRVGLKILENFRALAETAIAPGSPA